MVPPAVPYTFSIFTVSVVISKVIRLAAYIHAVPLASFLLLFPTFWIFDISAICIARLLLWHQARGILASVAFCFSLSITFLTLIGAACQVGFYIKTGTELDWGDAPAFLTNKNSIVVLLSGSWRVLASASFILTLAYFAHQPLYRGFGAINSSIALQVRQVAQWLHLSSRCAFATTRKHKLDDYEAAKLLANEIDFTGGQDAQCQRIDEPGIPPRKHDSITSKSTRRGFVPLLWLVAKVALLIVLVAGWVFRPSRPYFHMSTTLPASLSDIMYSSHDYCTEQQSILENEWPLPGLIDKQKWQWPAGRFKGWAPGPDSDLAQSYRDWTPSWMPKTVPRGFSRWNPMRLKKNHTEDRATGRCGEDPLRDTAYSPVDDPLRISNLDQDILDPIKEVLDQGSVKIKHVVYILMESLRSEFFPLQQGSDIHEAILSLSAEEDRELMNKRLSRLTPNTERITGVKGGFVDEAGLPFPEVELKWQDPVDDQHGGINVVGAYTSASMSTKSFAANHCGAWPMPVDTFDEAATDSYQPCMPQILNLWSDLKNDEASRSGDFRDHKWYPALFESMVETYDRQEIFDQKVGFKHIMTREQLEQEPDFDRSNPKYQKVNYFGFPEQVLKPHIKDYIRKTIANDQRIWMTHFTSTTHHAWKTPNWFNTTEYMPTGLLSGHRYFNRYLNTIRFNDLWMAELMQILEDTGIANETLVVFAGDHGMAFHEDDGLEGTYGNAHVSNLRVPISFRHPHLPRVQYHANATTISTLPTILDLLIHSGSLNKEDKAIASDLVHEYEGQSLIRPYKTSENGRRAWNFAVINPGGKMLAVTSADTPWKLVIPFGQVFPYSFSDLSNDPLQLNPTLSWTIEEVMQRAGDEHGPKAATWAQEAELVGKWWSTERKRLWRHHAEQALP